MELAFKPLAAGMSKMRSLEFYVAQTEKKSNGVIQQSRATWLLRWYQLKQDRQRNTSPTRNPLGEMDYVQNV